MARFVVEATAEDQMRSGRHGGAPGAKVSAADAVEAERRGLAEQVTKAVRRATLGLRDDLRGQVRAAGLGSGVANAWRGEVYPRSGVSAGAAGYVYSRAPRIHMGFAAGATIVPIHGARFLAIPTADAPQMGVARDGVNGGPVSPANWPIERFGPLKLSKRGNELVLVVEVIRARNGREWRPSTARRVAQGREVQEVVMFHLVPQAKLKKTLDPDAAFEKWGRDLGNLLVGDSR